MLEAFAEEVGLRLRRHGVTGEERLVLYDGGDCVSAASAAQVAELAGHPRVAVLAGGLASWPGEVQTGVAELGRTRAELRPRLDAVPTREELLARLDDESLTILDVRREEEYAGNPVSLRSPAGAPPRSSPRLEVSATLFDAPGLRGRPRRSQP